MTEYHCEFCGATGMKLRNEEKGCCNNCGAPIGITQKEAIAAWNEYCENLPYMGTSIMWVGNQLLYPIKDPRCKLGEENA